MITGCSFVHLGCQFHPGFPVELLLQHRVEQLILPLIVVFQHVAQLDEHAKLGDQFAARGRGLFDPLQRGFQPGQETRQNQVVGLDQFKRVVIPVGGERFDMRLFEFEMMLQAAAKILPLLACRFQLQRGQRLQKGMVLTIQQFMPLPVCLQRLIRLTKRF